MFKMKTKLLCFSELTPDMANARTLAQVSHTQIVEYFVKYFVWKNTPINRMKLSINIGSASIYSKRNTKSSTYFLWPPFAGRTWHLVWSVFSYPFKKSRKMKYRYVIVLILTDIMLFPLDDSVQFVNKTERKANN